MDVVSGEAFRMTVAADAVRPNDNTEAVNVGGEIAYNEMFYVRGGYKSLFRLDSEEGLTLGAGLQYRLFSDTDIAVDYTYASFGIFSNVQSLSFAVTF